MAMLLIVSGDSTMGQLCSHYFTERGITVHQVPGWKDAIDELENTRAVPNVVFMEAQLPDGSGQSLLGYLRTFPAFAQTQVIILTEAGVSPPFRFRPQFEHILPKPVSHDGLTAHIAKYLT